MRVNGSARPGIGGFMDKAKAAAGKLGDQSKGLAREAAPDIGLLGRKAAEKASHAAREAKIAARTSRLVAEKLGERAKDLGAKANGAALDATLKAGSKLSTAAADLKFAAQNPALTAKDLKNRAVHQARNLAGGARMLKREYTLGNHIPEGLPGRAGRLGKIPVGPNYYESLEPKQRKGLTPNYPVSYSIPAAPKGTSFLPTGEKASFTTGPNQLKDEYRVPGRFDYGSIPDISISPLSDFPIVGTTTLDRAARTGLPFNPETGVPLIPKMPDGKYSMKAVEPGHATPRTRKSELDLSEMAKRPAPDPYDLSDF